MSTPKTENEKEADSQTKRQSEYVSMKRDDYKRIKDNFSLLKAKFLKSQQQNQSFQNLYATLSIKDEEIKMYKDKAHRFELDFMRSQAQLSNLALKIGQQNGGKSVDFSGILEVIKDSSSSSSTDEQGVIPKSTGIPKSVEQEYLSSETSTKDSVKLKSRSTTGDTGGGVVSTFSGEIDVDGAEKSGVSQETLNKVIRENHLLRSKIQDFEKNNDAWKNFKTHDEQMQLISELRLELARVQVHNAELRMLLQAKHNANTDALTQKLTEYMAKMQKSEKQLTSKQALLTVVEKEYRRIKVEYEKLSGLQDRLAQGGGGGVGGGGGGGAMGGHDEHHTSLPVESIGDAGYNSSEIEIQQHMIKQLTQEKEALEQKLATTEEVNSREHARLDQEVDELRESKRQLEQQMEELQGVIATLQGSAGSGRSTLDDQPITRAAMQEDNQRLRDRIKLFQQEEQEMRDNYSILEGQMSNVQHALEVKSDELRRAQQEYDKVQAHSKACEEMIESKQKLIIELSNKNSEYKQTITDYKTLQRQGDGRTSLPSYSDALPPHHLPWTNRHQAPQQRRIVASDGGMPQSDDASQRIGSLPTPEYMTSPSYFDRSYQGEPPSRSASSATGGCVLYPRTGSSSAQSASGATTSSSSGLAHAATRGQRIEMPDGGGRGGGGSVSGSAASMTVGDTEAAFKCERCYRMFESHEEYKYKDHIRKCQD